MIELDGSSAAWAVAAASLMSSWWSRPTAEEIATWADLGGLAAQVAQHLGLDRGVLQPALLHVHGGSGALGDEYERLFVGPGTVPCAPYESVWRQDVPIFDRGALLGPAAVAVEDLYRKMGLRIRPSAHELPDHLAVEWEALAYALGEANDLVVARGLLADHLQVWMPPFCGAVAREADADFYRALSELAPRWADVLAGLLETSMPESGPDGLPAVG